MKLRSWRCDILAASRLLLDDVGFLDDLKRQAEAVKAEQTVDVAVLERNTLLAEAACKTAFNYLDTLMRQLEVLKPVSKARYVLDRRTSFDKLPLSEMKVDARRKKLRGSEVCDYIALHARLRNGQKLALVKDFLPDIEQIESRIRQSGAPVHAQAVRNAENGKLQEMRYELAVDFALAVHITPEHDRGRLLFKLINFDGFETVTAEFSALEVGSARLDELARWLLGEPHRFLDGAQGLRRVEA
jgi:hypothetical protein